MKKVSFTQYKSSKWINIYRQAPIGSWYRQEPIREKHRRKKTKTNKQKLSKTPLSSLQLFFFYSRYFSVLSRLNPPANSVTHNQLAWNKCGRCLAISIHLTSIVLISTKSATVAQLFGSPELGNHGGTGAICVARVELTVSKTERNEKRKKLVLDGWKLLE